MIGAHAQNTNKTRFKKMVLNKDGRGSFIDVFTHNTCNKIYEKCIIAVIIKYV